MPDGNELTRPELTRPELTRTVAADHPDRRIAAPATMAPLFLRVEPGTREPIVVETAAGHAVARFAQPGDVAIFASADRRTLPAEIVGQWEMQRAGL